MFILPAYDPTALAMLGFGILGRRGFGLWILTGSPTFAAHDN